MTERDPRNEVGEDGLPVHMAMRFTREGHGPARPGEEHYVGCWCGERACTLWRPEIVVLCGSTRFYDEYQEAYYRFTMEGKIVLSVGFYPHATEEAGHGEGVVHDSAQKVMLDLLHLRKIDMADYVYVLNPDGYIGDSTRREIAYAEGQGKAVHYLEESN